MFRTKLICTFLVLSLLPLALFFILKSQLALPDLTVAILIALISIVLALTSAFFLSSPLLHLFKITQKIDQGDLTAKAEIASGGDELEQIGHSINNLTLHLQQTLSNFDKSQKLVDAEKNKLDITLSSIIDPVIAVDAQKTIVLFNRAAEKMTDYKAEQVIGKSIDEVIKLFDKKEKEIPSKTYCLIKPDNFEGVTFSTGELKLVSAAPQKNDYQHKEAYVNLTVAQIKEGPSVNLGCILTFHDTTQETELSKMQLDFVSMAAHELRTPLTSIKGYLSVFIDENKSTLNEDQMMFLNRINNSAQHLTMLIENLLNVTRIERGAFSVSLESIDWVTMARQITQELQVRAKEKNIDLQFIEPTNQISHIKADKLRINEVLTNLIANALNYTPPQGTVRVFIEEKDEPSSPAGKNVITHVQDSGPGIAPELQHHLFKKFFRTGSKLTKETKGTGLGLYISKAIVDLHRGQIWVESTPGKGANFSFSIPVYEDSHVPFEITLKSA